MSDKPKLLDEPRIVARLKHLSPKTEKAYTQHIKSVILFQRKRQLLEMGTPEVRECLS